MRRIRVYQVSLCLSDSLLQPEAHVTLKCYIDAFPELSPEEADAARDELLDIRGQYLLKNKVVESVLSANPILKAVHSGIDASPVERYAIPGPASPARETRHTDLIDCSRCAGTCYRTSRRETQSAFKSRPSHQQQATSVAGL